jgi:hypothetical protein
MTWTLDAIIGFYFATLIIGCIIMCIGGGIITTWPNNSVAIYLGASICAIGAIFAAAPIMTSIVYFGEKLVFTFIEVTEYLFANF